jgi:hypothetical protein
MPAYPGWASYPVVQPQNLCVNVILSDIQLLEIMGDLQKWGSKTLLGTYQTLVSILPRRLGGTCLITLEHLRLGFEAWRGKSSRV